MLEFPPSQLRITEINDEKRPSTRLEVLPSVINAEKGNPAVLHLFDSSESYGGNQAGL